MAPKYQEQGGGPATGLADEFIKMLQQGIFGNFGAPTTGARAGGANPMGDTQGIAGVLSDILSGGAGNLGGSMSEMISKQNERDVAGLRARYGASGGMGYGTPAAFAESTYRAEAAPRATMAVGNLQLQALGQLLPMLASLSGKGIAQREGVMTPNPWASGAAIAAPLIAGGLNMMAPGAGSLAGLATSGLMAQPNYDAWKVPDWQPRFGGPP